MSKNILFTAVGTHDPVTMVKGENNKCEDGSILTICRNIKPNKVYLYLSSELNELEKKDSRFSLAIKKLNSDINVELIQTNDNDNVADFDYYINIFKKELLKIKNEEIQDNDNLYVNISSGTPQMKSALLLLGVWCVLDIKCCQVITPNEKSNFGENIKNYCQQWTDDIENISDKKDTKMRFKILNESSELAIPNLQCSNLEQNIIKLVNRYDYAGSLELVSEIEKINNNRINKYKRLIEIVNKREKLDYASIKIMVGEKWRDENLKKEVKNTFLINSEYNKINCFEYILNLELKLKKEQFADFYRGINPILYNMYISLFENLFGTIDKYSMKVNGELHWDKNKLLKEDRRVYDYLVEGFNDEHKTFDPDKGFIDSNTLYIPIIKCIKEEKNDIAIYINHLEKMRRRRNNIAHDFAKKAINDNTIENILEGFYSFKNIERKTLVAIKWMKKIFVETFGEIDEDKWNAFDIINHLIVKRIKESN